MLAFLVVFLEQAFLGQAALLPQRVQLHGIQLGSLRRQLLLQMASQSEVDVIAAEQDVLTHRDALELQLARLLCHRDQGEIGGASADVDYQNQVAHLNPLAPVGMPLDPGVEGGLRFLQQQWILISGLLRCLQRKLARHGVERGRHGYQHLLLCERRVRHLLVPGGAQMLQISPRCLHW